MIQITVQLEAGNPYSSGSAVFLDINSAQQRLQLGFNIENYVRASGIFNANAAEFAYFASIIYGCDRAVNRESHDGDRWTREFSVQIPITDPCKWTSISNLIESAIEFLTGDIWHLDFVATSVPLFGRKFRTDRNNFRKRTRICGTAVSLFSGGLDSLVGVINWLEDNPTQRIVLASTYDAQAENSRADQERLLLPLKAKYTGRIQRYVARTGLCNGGEDTNFRSRSLVFIGNAVLAASFLGDGTPIVIPENGAIALNYPLTPARKGSLSTRTVHPHYIAVLGSVLDALGLRYPLINPYSLNTKGEMLQECKNPALLQSTYADSASCGKRGHKEYWEDKHSRQCGACVPCIYRRAAVHRVGFPSEQYGYGLTSGAPLQNILSHPNHDLSSIIDFIQRNDGVNTIWRTLRSSGPLDISLKDDYTSLIARLRNEVKEWAQHMGII
jgi:hypothetical protein